MCGIVGAIANTEAAPMMLEALRRLEYRGYDSAGVATLNRGDLGRRRAVGKLNALETLLQDQPILGRTGIGHTRWATHGKPNETNAHPHATERVAVVHNGIIENYRELRDDLESHGVACETDTDTETVAKLCDLYLRHGADPKEAVQKTLKRLEGAFALAFVFAGADDMIIVARRGSPLAIGFGDQEMFIGSDAMALAPMTQRICYLEEGDWAVVTRSGAQIFDASDRQTNREVKTVAASATLAEKGAYRHFMAKEIHEQPAVSAYALAGYLDAARASISLPIDEPDFRDVERLTMTACGTAYYACAIAKYWFESMARLSIELDVASEFRYREPPMAKNGAALVVSQSGETADTLAAMRYCREQNQKLIAVVNVPTSTMAREADSVLPTLAGPEIGVASTKAFTTQLLVLLSLAITAAKQRGHLTAAGESALVNGMLELPSQMTHVLQRERLVARMALQLSQARDVLYIGRGPMYPLALEGALKLKEISYIHAAGYPGGELKHGAIALVDDQMPVVVAAPRDALFEKTISSMKEVMARGGRVILISDREGLQEAGEGVWQTIQMPPVQTELAPILYALPIQLLAYHTAVHKGTDVDQPRNLAKSVTVE